MTSVKKILEYQRRFTGQVWNYKDKYGEFPNAIIMGHKLYDEWKKVIEEELPSLPHSKLPRFYGLPIIVSTTPYEFLIGYFESILTPQEVEENGFN